MAYTVEIIVTPGSGNVTATARSGGTGTANSSGYAITQVTGNLHTITIAEELLGPWALTAGDGSSMRVLEFKAGKNSYMLSEDIPDAVLAAAADNPIHANVTQVNSNPANPSTNVAQQTTLLTLVDLVNSLEGEGLYAINVELFSAEGPVGKVIINIVGTNLTRITTNSGMAQFPVNPGTYTLRFDVPYGYAPIPDQTVVVTTADVTKEIEMTLTTVTPPSDPSLCDLYGRVVGSNGSRLKDVEVKAILSHMVKNIRDDIPMATLLETKTGEDGTFNLTLMRFASYELTFTTPEAKRKTVKVQIGDQPTALISTVIR